MYGLRLRWAQIVAVACLALIVGLAVSSIASASAREHGPARWPVNAAGQTYGSGLRAVSPKDEPDLICVEATNGLVGYSLRTDLEDPDPSSPEEAVRIQASRAGASRFVPVYRVDGETQIGVFVIDYAEPVLR